MRILYHTSLFYASFSCNKVLAYFLNGFLSGLQEKERVCFVKRYYFNSSVKEIEKQTHIPRSSVYMILEKVKKELKEDLMKEGYL